MRDNSTKASLSTPRRRLIETMQRLNFGRIEGLEVRRGEPVFQPAPRIFQEIKIGGENGPRPEVDRQDFTLKGQVLEMLQHLDQINDGKVAVVHVQHGLPIRLTIEQPE